MRTAILSIAALASGVLAAPSWEGHREGSWDGSWSKQPQGTGWGSWSSSEAASSTSSAVSSSAVSSSSSSSTVAVSPVSSLSSAPHTSSVTGSLTFSASKNATSSIGSTGTAPAKSTTYTTNIVTVYTTVCPVTKTHVTGGTTATTTFITTSTVTSSYTSTIISKITSTPVVGPASSTVVPSSTVTTAVTDVTTIYTTVCPATSTHVTGATTLTTTFQTTSVVTSVIKSTITKTIAVTHTIPVGSATPVTSNTWEGDLVTKQTTLYTTVCPASATITQGSSTWISSWDETLTLTNTETWTETFVSTVQWGTQILTYSVSQPISFPTSTPTTFVGPDSYTKAATSKGYTNTWGTWDTGSSTTTTGGAIGSVTGSATGSRSGSATGSTSGSASGSVTTKKSVSPSGSVTSKSTTASGTGSTRPHSTGTATRSAISTGTSKPSCIPCEGQPGNDPKKWCGYTINDNSYKVRPKTCRTVEYDFTVTNTTFAPDGFPRLGLLVNGQMPGPKIEANWGDEIVVRVHNQLTENGTAIHFHGQRQNYTNEMDGVPSITQCPLAPGEVQTYRFFADNYGTSWWHSHYALQIYSGVFGPMVIHGPASAEYDAEEFVVIQDWNHVPLDVLYGPSQTVGNDPSNGPQTLDTGLVNGKNVFGSSGSRYTLKVDSGKTYRIRLLNSAVQTTFKFYLDGHSFQVIANDYVPIKPYTTNIVNINPGQRYDVIFKADQPVGNYWLRADAQQTCTALKNPKDIKGIISYNGAPAGNPTSTAYTYTEECIDEPLASLVPVKTISAGSQEQNLHETVLIGGNGGTPNLYKWTLSGTTFQSQYGDPTLVSIYNNGSIPSYSGNLAIEVPKLGEWVYVIIESPIPVPHPIHLHGHDFLILAQGYGAYSSSVALNTASPARRDSALLPGNRGQGGYLVVAFEADNPGAWLMHCHIGWHSAMGFALQIIENLDGISDTVKGGDALNGVCQAWSKYATSYDIHVEDSGI